MRELPPDALRDHPLLQAAVSLLLMDRKREASREELAEVFAALKAEGELLEAGKPRIIARCNASSSVANAAMLDALSLEAVFQD